MFLLIIILLQDCANNARCWEQCEHARFVKSSVWDHTKHKRSRSMTAYQTNYYVFEVIEKLEVIWHGLFVKVLVNGAWHIEKVYNILYSK